MKINQALEQSQEKLKNNIKDYQKEALLIASFVLELPPEKIITQLEKKIKKSQFKKIIKLSEKRSQNWPLAYLTGTKSFYNLDFIVNKNTLIPRPESELIIEEIIKNNFNTSEQETIIIDIGTGSGCLIISLADILKSEENISFYALDISQRALKVAKRNARKYKLRKIIKFLKGNLLKPIRKKLKNIKEESHIIIIANLPYLTKEEIKKEPSIQLEPRQALYGGKDGLKYYKKLWSQIKKIKEKNNKINFTVYQEINNWQKEKLEEMIIKKMRGHSPQSEIIKDLNNQQRLLITKI